jgi:hypothetical protein
LAIAAVAAQAGRLAAEVYERGHPWQRNVNDDDARLISILTGRGCGKTEVIDERLVRRMLRQPGARCIYFATTREQVIDLMWEPMKALLSELGILDDCKVLEVPLRIRLPNDSRIQMVGADDMKSIEKHRGKPYDEAWIDEAASFPIQLLDHLMNRVIKPRLRKGGTIGIAGTPGHHLVGEFYEATRPGSEASRPWTERDKPEYAGWGGWSHHSWSQKEASEYVEAIADIWEASQADMKAKGWGWDHPVVMREVLGLWAADDTDHVFRYRSHADDGSAWNQWDPERDGRGVAILPEIGRHDDWCYGWGIDLGFSDPLALEVFAWHPHDAARTLYHIFELNKRELYAREFAQLLIGEKLDHDNPGGLVGATGWPEATAVDDAGLGGSFIKELGEVYGIRLEAADKKNKFGDIEGFNGNLLDGRIKVLKGSILEEQLIHNQWSKDDFGQHKRNKSQRDDACDAAVYLAARAAHLHSRAADPAPARKVSDFHRAGAEVVDASRGEYDELFKDEDYGSMDDGAWG